MIVCKHVWKHVKTKFEAWRIWEKGYIAILKLKSMCLSFFMSTHKSKLLNGSWVDGYLSLVNLLGLFMRMLWYLWDFYLVLHLWMILELISMVPIPVQLCLFFLIIIFSMLLQLIYCVECISCSIMFGIFWLYFPSYYDY